MAAKKSAKKTPKKKVELPDLQGLWFPFLVDGEGDKLSGRRAPALLWEKGEFTAIEFPGDSSGRTPLERGLLDGALALTLPGLVCGHVEPIEALFAGYPRKPGSHAGEDALTRDEISAAAGLCAAEAALAGVTTVYAMHRAPFFNGVLDVYADAFRVTGVRLVIGVDVDEETAGIEGARAAMRENIRFATLCAERDDGMSAAMAGVSHPDSLPTLLTEMVGEARRAELSFHLTLLDPAASRRRLAEKGALRSGSVAVVAAALDEEERALIRDLEVFPVTAARGDIARGAGPGLLRGFARRLVYGGVEGNADVLAERDAFAAASTGLPEAERIAAWRPIVNGWDLAAATLDRGFGRFSPGAPADLVVLDARLPGDLTSVSLASHLARVSARDVRHVVVAGKTVVKDGELVNVDESSIRTQALSAASSAWRRAGKKT